MYSEDEIARILELADVVFENDYQIRATTGLDITTGVNELGQYNGSLSRNDIYRMAATLHCDPEEVFLAIPTGLKLSGHEIEYNGLQGRVLKVDNRGDFHVDTVQEYNCLVNDYRGYVLMIAPKREYAVANNVRI